VTVVLAVAVVGMALLAAAVLLDNTIVAAVVIVIAIVGLVLLARVWLDEHRAEPQRYRVDDEADEPEEVVAHEDGLEPDEFEPDVEYEDEDAADTT
jgi:multisubunit Na+/H+ antiporter MnhG subunit